MRPCIIYMLYIHIDYIVYIVYEMCRYGMQNWTDCLIRPCIIYMLYIHIELYDSAGIVYEMCKTCELQTLPHNRF